MFTTLCNETLHLGNHNNQFWGVPAYLIGSFPRFGTVDDQLVPFYGFYFIILLIKDKF